MELYWFWSTNPQKVRFALEEIGCTYELKTVDLFERENMNDSFRALSPRGKVPALRLDDGSILWESGAALTWLGQTHQRLWPQSSRGQADALNLLFMESAAFQEQAGVHFFNRVVLPTIGKRADETRVLKASQKIKPLLQLLSNQLADRPFLLGDISVVDCAYAPWLPVLYLDEFPRLAAWRDRLESRDAWARCDFRYSSKTLGSGD